MERPRSVLTLFLTVSDRLLKYGEAEKRDGSVSDRLLKYGEAEKRADSVSDRLLKYEESN